MRADRHARLLMTTMAASEPQPLTDNPIARSMEILGERWTLLIVAEILAGHHRFGQIQRRLGLARTVLSARLALLVAHGVASAGDA